MNHFNGLQMEIMSMVEYILTFSCFTTIENSQQKLLFSLVCYNIMFWKKKIQ